MQMQNFKSLTFRQRGWALPEAVVFEEMIREICRLDECHRIPVSVPSDAEGYFDRECPSGECLFQFKVHLYDWHNVVRDEEVFCPFCGHTAASDKWCTREQSEYLKSVVMSHVKQRLGRAMKRDADRWNRQQSRDSFFSITMEVGNRPQHVSLPLAAAKPMRLKIKCTECACRYAVVGAAFFCPACGNNGAELVFCQSLNGVRGALSVLAEVHASVADRDIAETMVRLITENGFQNAVTAFQRYAEALYAKLPGSSTARRNVFQNLTEGSNLWYAATGKQYSDYLDPDDLTFLQRAFQRRHLLAHTQGIVDQDYVSRTGDPDYRLGQRVVIRASAVLECVDLIEKLASGLAREV